MSGFSSLFNRLQGFVGNNPVTNVIDSMFIGTENNASITTVPFVNNLEDKKVLEKAYKYMEMVIRSCQQPKLNLKSSPPFILDILPSMSQLLTQIFSQDPDVLQANEYLSIFVQNLIRKCKETQKLFRNADIFLEDSASRSSLMVMSLVFSHMLHELKAEFPDKQFIGTKFRITKKDAANFWTEHFQNRTLIPWEEFRTEISKVHKLQVGVQTSALLQTIDLTRNEYISNFEFDVFTRLFHPWTTLIQNWECLAVTHPAYMSFITYEEVKRKLQRFTKKPGSYVFRLSCTRLGQWAIGYVAKDQKIYQTIPSNKSLVQSLVDGAKDGFYLYPMGKEKNVDLSYMLETSKTEDRVKVTSEQYQIYCEMGTTFEICKICDERDKNVKLEPCGHLICRPCLTSWQESAEGGSTCPWCRCEIKGTEKIIIESFKRDKNEEKSRNNINKRASTTDSEKEEQSTSQPPPIPPKRPGKTATETTSAPPSCPPPTFPAPQIPPRSANFDQSNSVLESICNDLATIDFSLPATK
ncbi:hypothetical protein FO519_005538 [Halicephalobus sp. NKZ332]|nr:hypothetical protein FO519_005538 [Halicephalobus sp. NKZ332]